MLLSGGAPSVLDRGLVAHHQQTWKLREYYLAEHPDLARAESRIVGCGDPLKAYFSSGTRWHEFPDSVEICEPGRDTVQYWRSSHPKSDGERVVDIIILGEVPRAFVFGTWLY